MINRIDDKAAIESIFQRYNGKAGILLLYAHTGVGKSLLIDRIFQNKSDSCYIRLEINQQEAQETKGLYISCLAKALNKYAHDTNKFSTLESFVENIYIINKDNEKVVNDFLDVVAELVKAKTIKEKLDQNKKFKKDLIDKVLQNDNDVAVTFLLDYILYITKERRLAVSIENIQQANKRLVLFLKTLLQKTQNIFLIGEYTIHSSEDELTSLFKEFPFDSIEIFELPKLNKKELIGGIKQIAIDDNEEALCGIIENSYDESYGNLAKLDLLLKKNNQFGLSGINKSINNIKYDDAMHSLYSGLTSNQKMLLWYIVTHLGRIHLNIFSRFIKNFSVEDPRPFETLESLISFKLIRKSNDIISLGHDSFIELLKQEEDFKKFALIANNDWLIFYRTITIDNNFNEFTESGVSSQDLFILQLVFILNIGGNGNLDWMNVILSKINESLNNNTFSYSLISKVTSIFYEVIETNTNKKLLNKTYEWIILILSKLGYSEEIVKIRTAYNPPNTSDLLFLLQSSASVATCDRKIIEDLKANAEMDTAWSFRSIGAKLLLLRYYRTFNQKKLAQNVWTELLKLNQDQGFKNVILDQVNLCSFNFKKRQTFLNQSKEGHKLSGNYYQYCSTLLNSNANAYYLYFLKLLSKKKFLQAASENLDIVKDILAASHYPMHAYLNQKSIFQLVAGNVNEDILLTNFQTAYLNCGISGNKPLIGANILAVALQQNNLTGVREYADQLMQMSRIYSELNSEFSKYPLINCYNYFRRIKDREGQKEAIYLLKKGKTFNSVGSYLTAVPFVTETFLRGIRYFPCNIVNWDIDFEAIQARL